MSPRLHLPPQGLRGGGVAVRRPVPEDAPAVFHACQDPDIQRWTEVPVPYTEADAREFVEGSADEWAAGAGAHLVVTGERTGDLLGAVGLVHIDHRASRAEIGYWVRREARGRGIAAAALLLVARWALLDVGFARVQLVTDVRNAPSRRVAEKAGFRREGLLRSYAPAGGERGDYLMYGLLPPDLDTGSPGGAR